MILRESFQNICFLFCNLFVGDVWIFGNTEIENEALTD